jgi:hypothetical protein
MTETVDEATITVYRAVMDVELDDIARLGALRNPAGIEVKYFSTTVQGAAWYARAAHKAFGDGPFTIVETRLPISAISDAMRVTVDGRIPTVTISTALLPQLSPPRILPYVPITEE